MNAIRQKMTPAFRQVEGGLFAEVTKADVGGAADRVLALGGDMIGWADPFAPDDTMPEEFREIAIRQIREGRSAHYTHPIGLMALKEAIARKLLRQNGIQADPARNILVTPGSDSGLLFAMMPFIEAGDEVMVFDPSYPNNFLDPALLGGKAVSVLLDAAQEYVLTQEALDAAYSPKTKLVLLTNPNNPTGTVLSPEEMVILRDFIVEKDLVAVVDQAFEDCVFPEATMTTLAAMAGMWERTVTVFSVSKGMALSGVRVGYIVADDQVMDVLYGCAVNVIGATNTTFQPAVAWALDHPEFMENFREQFDARRKKVYALLSGIPGVKPLMPRSTFMMWVDVSGLGSAEEVAAYLMDKALVCVNAGTSYGTQGKGHLRIVFGCYADENRMYAAMGRVREALIRMGNERK